MKATENALNSISCVANSLIVRTVSAAKKAPFAFYTVPDNSTSTMETRGGKCLNSALETIEGVVLTSHDDFKRFVVGVVANHACAHSALLP